MKTIAILAVLAAMQLNAFAQDKPAASPATKAPPPVSAPAAAPLPRRAGPMGVRLQPGAAGGLEIAEVVPGSPAAEAGLESGFRLVSVQGKAIDSREQLAGAMRAVRGGEPVQVQVQRGNEPARTVTVTLQPPSETLLGNTVRYDSVQVPAGYRLRTIITQPNASPLASNGKLPAMLYVQGIVCDSVDRPDRPDAVDTRIIHDIARAGYVTMRVDKPGLGD
ncbi:MAG: PDZ domain-containing protein, partial [Planctomycetaceae bacterium]|nr:PDZ domain-containing protein [Planctomycetaceae bacterium]